jgi:hypothetical protein
MPVRPVGPVGSVHGPERIGVLALLTRASTRDASCS